MEMVDGDTDHNSIVATVKSKRNCKKKQENEFRNEEKTGQGQRTKIKKDSKMTKPWMTKEIHTLINERTYKDKDQNNRYIYEIRKYIANVRKHII